MLESLPALLDRQQQVDQARALVSDISRKVATARLIQHAQRVFAMIPGHSYEFGQDLLSLPPSCGRLIPFSNRIFQLSPCRHAQLPRHLLHHPAAPLPGSSLREATGIDPVTKIVSQCADERQLFLPVVTRLTDPCVR